MTLDVNINVNIGLKTLTFAVSIRSLQDFWFHVITSLDEEAKSLLGRSALSLRFVVRLVLLFVSTFLFVLRMLRAIDPGAAS